MGDEADIDSELVSDVSNLLGKEMFGSDDKSLSETERERVDQFIAEVEDHAANQEVSESAAEDEPSSSDDAQATDNQSPSVASAVDPGPVETNTSQATPEAESESTDTPNSSTPSTSTTFSKPTSTSTSTSTSATSIPNTLPSSDPLRRKLPWVIESNWWFVVCLFPLLGIAGALDARLPVTYHAAVEIGHFGQTIALLKDPLASYTYVTLQESTASIHLYSILSAPFVALGYFEGGRLISFISILIAALALNKIADISYSNLSAGIAPLVFVGNPLVLRWGYWFGPEALGIALTTLSVLAIVLYDRSEHVRWYYASVTLIILGVMNHLWEATILLPVVAVLYDRQEWKRLIAAGVVTVVAVAVCKSITTFQPNVASLGHYNIISTGPFIFLKPEYWQLDHANTPFFVAAKLLMPAVYILAIVKTVTWWRTRSSDALLEASWLVSGVSILVLLPGGAIPHSYYLWALPAPFAFTAARTLERSYLRLYDVVNRNTAQRVLIGSLVLFSMWGAVTAASVEAGSFHDSDIDVLRNQGESRKPAQDVAKWTADDVGKRLRGYGVSDASEVTFVGEWNDRGYGAYLGPVRILMYGGVNLRDMWKFGAAHTGAAGMDGNPTFVKSVSEVDTSDCEVMIILKNDQSTEIQRCDSG